MIVLLPVDTLLSSTSIVFVPSVSWQMTVSHEKMA